MLSTSVGGRFLEKISIAPSFNCFFPLAYLRGRKLMFAGNLLQSLLLFAGLKGNASFEVRLILFTGSKWHNNSFM